MSSDIIPGSNGAVSKIPKMPINKRATNELVDDASTSSKKPRLADGVVMSDTAKSNQVMEDARAIINEHPEKESTLIPWINAFLAHFTRT